MINAKWRYFLLSKNLSLRASAHAGVAIRSPNVPFLSTFLENQPLLWERIPTVASLPRNDIAFFDTLRHPIGMPYQTKAARQFTVHRTAPCRAEDSPTAGKHATGMFSFPPFESDIHSIKQRHPYGMPLFYGVDNGTRTHDLQSHNLTP